MYSSHATTHFNLVRLFLRRTMSTQHWSRVKCRKQTRQRMESAIETSDLKLSGDLVQTFKNCDAEHERTFNSSATDLDNGWNKSGR